MACLLPSTLPQRLQVKLSLTRMDQRSFCHRAVLYHWRHAWVLSRSRLLAFSSPGILPTNGLMVETMGLRVLSLLGIYAPASLDR